MSEANAGSPRDFKLAGLVPWLTRADPLPGLPANPEIKRVYEASVKNLWRVDLPIITIALVMFALHLKLTGEQAESPGDASYAYGKGLEAWQMMTSNSNFDSYNFGLGIEGTLSSCIVTAYTAFETLTGDLWEAVVNQYPEIITQADCGKQVAVWELQINDYNLKNKMGSILRPKYNFDALKGIREAYARFQVVEVDTALADPSLDTVAAIRQVLVHRGGIADDEYLRKTKSLALAPQAPKGSPVHLDGDIVAALLFASLPRVIEVVKRLDGIVTHALKGESGP